MGKGTVAYSPRTRGRRLAGLLSLVGGLLLLAVLPLSSAGQRTGVKPVDKVLNTTDRTVRQVTNTVQSTTEQATGQSGSGSASTGAIRRRAATSNPQTEPPLHGTNPHGQGSGAVVDLSPSNERPLSGDPDGGDSQEDVVVGRSRGEQRADGSYHGHVTIAALFGNELLGVDSNPGQNNHGPLQGLQVILDQLCTGSSICLSLLTADSATTDSGSTNRFSVASAQAGDLAKADAVETHGNISESGSCQTSEGRSSVTNANVGNGAVTAGVAKSSSTSRGCSSGADTVDNESSVITLFGTGVPLPAAGCADGTPDTETGLPPLAPIVCNADDKGQAPAPAGVREALSVFALDSGNTSLLKALTSGSESVADADGPGTKPPGTNPPGTDPTGLPNSGTVNAGTGNPGTGNLGGNTGTGTSGAPPFDDGDGPGGSPDCSDGVDNDGDGAVDFPNDPGCASSSDDSETQGQRLAFTGADLLSLVMGGLLFVAAGLVLRRRLDLR